MTEHEGDQPDPLLVRPFLLHDTGVADDAPSTQTWPSATREVRSHRVLVGAPLTGGPKPAPKSPYPRRLLIVTAAGIAALAAVTAAGYAALGHGSRSSLAEPRPPLPAVTGPRISASPSPSTAPPSTGAPRQAAVPPVPTRSRPAANATSAASSPSPKNPTSSPASVRTSTPATPSLPAPTTPPAGLAPRLDRIGVIGGLNNLCLDLNGGVVVDDNHVQVFECNGSGAQQWTLATDGTLRVSGKCALVVGDGTVHIVGCDGRTTAQWRVAGRTLINASDSRCLTDPSDGTRSGAGVTVTPCTGAAEQNWNLP